MKYLKDMAAKDPMLYYNRENDSNGIFSQLFWSDGMSQLDYMLFGDVIAFDATYKKIRYDLPLVVLSGVNHNNQSVVFGAALVADEKDESYVWILENFLAAMKGKAPVSVITDGDRAMKRAIGIVFPNAHHRLCAWHLIRNATSNIGNPRFTKQFKSCMLGDYEIDVFRRKWRQLVEEFDVEGKPWIHEMYAKRHMWATAYIRGKFFAGFRTTSRCESLHSVISRYVKSRYDLSDFLEHFNRFVGHMRFNEFYAEYESHRAVPVMQTCYEPLERFAANLYTRAQCLSFFRPFLIRAASMKVVVLDEHDDSAKYRIWRYGKPDVSWIVDFVRDSVLLSCSCLRMESWGLPCEHILAVLVFNEIFEIPPSLILQRWTKDAKDLLLTDGGFTLDSIVNCRYGAFIECCKILGAVVAQRGDRFHESRDLIMRQYHVYKVEDEAIGVDGCAAPGSRSNSPANSNPRVSKTKGRSRRKPQRCSVCRVEGHNKTSCRLARRDSILEGDGDIEREYNQYIGADDEFGDYMHGEYPEQQELFPEEDGYEPYFEDGQVHEEYFQDCDAGESGYEFDGDYFENLANDN